MTRPSASDRYISALKRQGMMNQFVASRTAIVVGRKVCESIDNGGKDQGNAAGQVAAQYLCPAYFPKYHVLRVSLVTGTFTLSNGTYDPTNDFATANYQDAAGGCVGDGGFGDLNASTQVVVTGDNGTELTRTSLGAGVFDDSGLGPIDPTDNCVFTFHFHVTEGQGEYVVTVGHRGSTNYTFNQISVPDAIQLIIGNS